MTSTPRKAWLLALATVLALLAGPAFALGLGKIEIRSERGEPLLAEIQIISSDPAELEGLQARLASPDTFARVGLEPPQGIVTDLQFRIALDPRGNPVVRVTSRQPLDQALLTFLVEVEWAQGRLVREYSVLVDAPGSLAAPAQPPIEAPAPAPSNTIVREPAPTPAAPTPAEVPTQTPEQLEPETDPATALAEQAPEPEPQQNAIPTPPPATPAAPEPAPQPTAATPARTSNEYGPVQAGDTLGEIAATLDTGGYSLDQTMLALLRANPEAFIDDNINLVRQGAVLRMPSQDELTRYSAAEARAVVREQIAQWREMRAPTPQPVAVAGADAAEGADAGTGASAAAGAAAGAADARLEIVPPSASDGAQAGTRSGIDAEGEGDMLRQQQTEETLAAREAEVQELQARVAELEQLQQQQEQLLALQKSELAQAEQALAARQTDSMPWIWLLAALVVALLLAWLFMRRRPAQPGKPARPVFDTSAMAAGMPSQRTAPADPRPASAGPAPAAHESPAAAKPDKADKAVSRPKHSEAGAAAPTWHAGNDVSTVDAVPPSIPAQTGHEPIQAGHERLELARAYIDLGDVDTARALLQEVADGDDPAARDEATRLLREMP